MKRLLFGCMVFLLLEVFSGGVYARVSEEFQILLNLQNPSQSQVHLNPSVSVKNGGQVFIRKTKNGVPQKIRGRYITFPLNDFVDDPYKNTYCYEIRNIRGEKTLFHKKICTGLNPTIKDFLTGKIEK